MALARSTLVHLLVAAGVVTGSAPQAERVTIRVDTSARTGAMTPIWAWFGHDEPNYTCTDVSLVHLTW